MKQFVLSLLSVALVSAASSSLRAADHVVYEPAGEAKGKHIVLLSGDEEYRSEESLPMLGKLLSQRHGFKCTVLFSVGADGTIDPTAGGSLTHPEALDSADAIVMLLRFRHWDEATSKRFEAAINRGVPVIGLRTSTHAFNGYPKGSPYESWNFGNKGGWGRKFLGETWVSHWGKHKVEATKGVVEAANAKHAILRGVGEIFGNSDVYEAAPPEDATILVRGQILQGMTADTPPAVYSKKTSGTKVEQDVNSPMMPIAWTRTVKNDSGSENKVFCTTLGAATDLAEEGTRRMVVNSIFWGLGLEVPEKADVAVVGEYKPSMYGFKGFKTGLKPDDFVLTK